MSFDDPWQTTALNTYTYTLKADAPSPDPPPSPADLATTPPQTTHETLKATLITQLYHWQRQLSQEQYHNALLAEELKTTILHQLQASLEAGESLRSCDLAFIRSASKIEL